MQGAVCYLVKRTSLVFPYGARPLRPDIAMKKAINVSEFAYIYAVKTEIQHAVRFIGSDNNGHHWEPTFCSLQRAVGVVCVIGLLSVTTRGCVSRAVLCCTLAGKAKQRL